MTQTLVSIVRILVSMLPFLGVEVVLVFFACVSSYLTWSRQLASREMVAYFIGHIKASQIGTIDAEQQEKWRQTGFWSEIVRIGMLALLSWIAIGYYVVQTSLADLLALLWLNPVPVRLAIVFVLVLVVGYNGYFGPRRFAHEYSGDYRLFSWERIRKYALPYWVWMLYPLAGWGAIGLILLFMMGRSLVVLDSPQLSILMDNIHVTSVNKVSDLQFATIRLVDLGHWISMASQKYISTSLFAFVYVVFEQRSTLRTTILKSSVNRLIVGVWLALVILVAIPLVVWTISYSSLHLELRHYLELLTSSSLTRDELTNIINIQQNLENHDIRWLLWIMATGYGNLATLGIVGVGVLLWRTISRDVPLRTLMKLLVPEPAVWAIRRFVKMFAINYKFSDNDAPSQSGDVTTNNMPEVQLDVIPPTNPNQVPPDKNRPFSKQEPRAKVLPLLLALIVIIVGCIAMSFIKSREKRWKH